MKSMSEEGKFISLVENKPCRRCTGVTALIRATHLRPHSHCKISSYSYTSTCAAGLSLREYMHLCSSLHLYSIYVYLESTCTLILIVTLLLCRRSFPWGIRRRRRRRRDVDGGTRLRKHVCGADRGKRLHITCEMPLAVIISIMCHGRDADER